MEILDSPIPAIDVADYRKSLLPLWIKIFSWVFLLFLILVPATIIANLCGFIFNISFFGLEAESVFTPTGVILTCIEALCGITAYGLLWGKGWATRVAMVLAVLQLFICAFSMLSDLLHLKFSVRLEVIPIVIFMVAMYRLDKKWHKVPDPIN